MREIQVLSKQRAGEVFPLQRAACSLEELLPDGVEHRPLSRRQRAVTGDFVVGLVDQLPGHVRLTNPVGEHVLAPIDGSGAALLRQALFAPLFRDPGGNRGNVFSFHFYSRTAIADFPRSVYSTRG